MFLEDVDSARRSIEFDGRPSRGHKCLAQVRGYNINSLVRPWIANFEALRYPCLDDYGGYGTISCLDVHLCFPAHVDAAVKIPSRWNGGCNADDPS